MTATQTPSTAAEHIVEARRLLALLTEEPLTNEQMLTYLAFDSDRRLIVDTANAHTRIALVDAVLATGTPRAAYDAAAGEALIA